MGYQSQALIQYMDPIEMGKRFADGNEVEFEDNSMRKIFKEAFDSIKDKLSTLPPREIDILLLYLLLDKDQREIAKIFRVSQGTISHRLHRTFERLEFILKCPKLDVEELEEYLNKIITDKKDVTIMKLVYETSSQSVSAKKLNISQGCLRHRFFRTLKIIEKNIPEDEQYKLYFDVFNMLKDNFNIRRELTPQKRWCDRFVNYIEIK